MLKLSVTKMKPRTLFFITFMALAAVFVGFGARADDSDWDRSVDKVSAMTALVNKHYYQAVDGSKLMQESAKGLLQTLDPHSYFLDPDDFARMFEEQRGKYYGIGTQIQKQEDRLVVIAPIEGGPSWRLGVQAGDIISHINGESTKPISSQDAVDKLRGPKGTKVNVTFVREGLEKPFELTIAREEIPLYSVPYAFLVDDGVGYVFIRNFAENTGDEFREKLESLTKQGMKSLILDLRGNPAGPSMPRSTFRTSSSPRERLSSRSRAATGSMTGSISPSRTTRSRSCPSSSSSTRAAPALRRSSPARSWTMTAGSWSDRTPSARASSRPSSPSPRTWPSP